MDIAEKKQLFLRKQEQQAFLESLPTHIQALFSPSTLPGLLKDNPAWEMEYQKDVRLPWHKIDSLFTNTTRFMMNQARSIWPDLDPFSVLLLKVADSRSNYFANLPYAGDINSWDDQSKHIEHYHENGFINLDNNVTERVLHFRKEPQLDQLFDWSVNQKIMLDLFAQGLKKGLNSPWHPQYGNIISSLSSSIAVATQNFGYLKVFQKQPHLWQQFTTNKILGEPLLHRALAANFKWLAEEAVQHQPNTLNQPDETGYLAYHRCRETLVFDFLLNNSHLINLSKPHPNGEGGIIQAINKTTSGNDNKNLILKLKKQYPNWNPSDETPTAQSLLDFSNETFTGFQDFLRKTKPSADVIQQALVASVLSSAQEKAYPLNIKTDYGTRALHLLLQKYKTQSKSLWLSTPEGPWPFLALTQTLQQKKPSADKQIVFLHQHDYEPRANPNSILDIIQKINQRGTPCRILFSAIASENPDQWLDFLTWLPKFMEDRYLTGHDHQTHQKNLLDRVRANECLIFPEFVPASLQTPQSQSEALDSGIKGEMNYLMRLWLEASLHAPSLGAGWLLKHEIAIRQAYLGTWGAHPNAQHMQFNLVHNNNGYTSTTQDFPDTLQLIQQSNELSVNATGQTISTSNLDIAKLTQTPLFLYWTTDLVFLRTLYHQTDFAVRNSIEFPSEEIQHLSKHTGIFIAGIRCHNVSKSSITRHIDWTISWQTATLEADKNKKSIRKTNPDSMLPLEWLTHMSLSLQKQFSKPSLVDNLQCSNQLAPKPHLKTRI